MRNGLVKSYGTSYPTFTAILGLLLAPMVTGALPVVSASSARPFFDAAGAVNGERFSPEAGHAWKGGESQTNWWWQIRFDAPRDIGAILQIIGDHSYVRRNAPRRYVWQLSNDGRHWVDLKETATDDEHRMFRLHRLAKTRRAQYVRLRVDAITGEFPTVREVEFYDSPKARVHFSEWMVVVDTTEKEKLPGEGREFISLARSCPGWETMQAQQIWLGQFDESFVSVEPRPLCAFLSGNFKDWCEINREPWRGAQGISKKGRLPIWASCGGAQGLAILAESGVDHPWDCPHCRDPLHPKTPIYTHIGHTSARPCGDYSACVFERGPHTVRQVAQDPVFQGLSRDFRVMESHCGQIEWPPRGWMLIATSGPGTQTRTQCIRMKDRYVYAAQFHIEMAGTPEESRQIMGNFLSLAKAWGGYNPVGRSVRIPDAWTTSDNDRE